MEILFCRIRRHTIFVSSLLVFFSLVSPTTEATKNIPYRAAIYEHVVIHPPRAFVNRAQAVTNMMKNVRVYAQQTKIAASKGAQIIVFPENGILGIVLNRTTVKPYLEEVPDHRCVSWNPSENPGAYEGTEIVQELSRIAKENKIYLVANMGTKRRCTTKDDPSCPSDGQYQFNTNVVYSDNGLLVAVYHKRNLYIDRPFDPAPVPEYVTFDTPFGRFGTIICFDIMFKEPTYILFEKYKVRNLAYPTAWVKVKPFYRSIMMHSSFARGYSVNILTSDLHSYHHTAHGSGLYTPDGAREYFYDTSPTGVGKLLIADMDAINEETPLPHTTNLPKMVPDAGTNETILKGSVLGLRYQFKPLPDQQGVVKHCKGDFCCSVDYKMKQLLPSEKYVLGVANGFLYVQRRKLYAETCVLSKCSGENCVGEITSASTIFERFNLTGYNYKSSHFLPRVTAMNESSYVFVDNEWKFEHTSHIYAESPMSLPLHSAVLEGRVYHLDEPAADSGLKPDLPKCKKDTSGGTNGLNSDILTIVLSLLCVLVQWKN